MSQCLWLIFVLLFDPNSADVDGPQARESWRHNLGKTILRSHKTTDLETTTPPSYH